MKRRNFITTALVGMSTLAGKWSGSTLKPGDIPTRTFGKTEEKLTIVGQAGGRFGMISLEEAKAITLHAYELGINYFDTAHNYWGGLSEEVYGAILPPFRSKVFITTKSQKRTRLDAEKELNLSLRRLKTDYIDLWQIHSIETMQQVDQIFGPGGAIEAFEAAKREGKCRFIGFTGHFDPYVHLAMLERYKDFDSILIPLNPADPSYLSFEKLVLPEAIKQGLGIQGMKSLGAAKLLNRFNMNECISYVLSLPIHCLTLGCTTIGQLEDDVRLAKRFQPYSEKEMAGLRQRGEKLFEKSGPQLEDWKRSETNQIEQA